MHPDKTYDFRQSVDTVTHRLGSSLIEKSFMRIEPVALKVIRGGSTTSSSKPQFAYQGLQNYFKYVALPITYTQRNAQVVKTFDYKLLTKYSVFGVLVPRY